MLQVPNIVRRLADADNLPCRIGHYSHQDDNDDKNDALQNHILYVTELVPFLTNLLISGFFCHVPFPPWDMVKIHPWKDIFLQVKAHAQ